MQVSHNLLLERSSLLDLDMRDVQVDTSASPPLSPTVSETWGGRKTTGSTSYLIKVNSLLCEKRTEEQASHILIVLFSSPTWQRKVAG